MQTSLVTLLTIWACFLFLSAPCTAQVVWDRAHIDKIREQPAEQGTEIRVALERVRRLADEALQRKPNPVTNKTEQPPSGDLHDYQSFSRYWWPDPTKPDGLPYIRKDGIVNRKIVARGDRVRIGEFMEDVQALALAGYLFKDERYTQHASKLVRVWFLDKETKMNPNLNFAQGVPGRAEGRGPGIIDTRGVIFVLDSIELFESDDWSAQNQHELQAWFREFIQWLQTDELGLHEAAAKNNHGSWYDAQLARYALFVDDTELAKSTVQTAKTKRIAQQFDADGYQAEELARTQSLHYSMFNLTALSALARSGDRLDIDLWDYQPEHGSSLRHSLTMLLPYISGDSKWNHPQLKPYSVSRSASLMLRLFANRCEDSAFIDVTSKTKLRDLDQNFTALLVGRPKTK